MSAIPQLYRVRVLLKASQRVRLQAYQAAAIYALLAAANGRRSGSPALPDGVLLDTPEQCRPEVGPGEHYAFGFTLLAADNAHAGAVVTELLRGLADVGESAEAGEPVWGGNFRIAQVEDLVAGRAWIDLAALPIALTPVPAAHLETEKRRATECSRFNFHFTSPLRVHRRKRFTRPGHAFLDSGYFDAAQFVERLWDRLAGLGFLDGPCPPTADIEIADNHLIWLDFTYGPAAQRKRFGGVVGRITLARIPQVLTEALVLGQYVRAGLNTRFGFGAYRLEVLGAEPYPCRRAASLLEVAFGGPELDRAAHEAELASGRLRALSARVLNGSYQPASHEVAELSEPDGRTRKLAIPTIEDRALQRAVLKVLAPGLDLFFEDSSLAFRRNLGRHRAARALADAWADGYRWAVRADLHRFFDSIDHAELRRRLDAYLPDLPTVELLMAWVRAGAPFAGMGLPTGAPVSPLLANLFLDGFDETIAAEGGRLVRYADDFMILTRDQAEADRLLEAARRAAADVELRLNDEKTAAVDLARPFEFLGFRFEKHQHWQVTAGQEPLLVEELGWRDARSPIPFPVAIQLPGENDDAGDEAGLLVAGPGRFPIHIVGQALQCGDGRQSSDRSGLEAVVLIGEPELNGGVLRELAGRGIPLFITDRYLRNPVVLFGDVCSHSTDAIASLLRDDPEAAARALHLARPLITAKLCNYAALADVHPGRREDRETGVRLRELAGRAECASSFDELLGLEGAAARQWYQALPGRLPAGWSFSSRVAPNADDPVNVLLNIAFTFLHRWSSLAVRAAGLLPEVGLLHRPRAGHAALASDLQEVFRHVMERAVLEILARLSPRDFRRTPAGRFALTLSPYAAQQVAAGLHRSFRRAVLAQGQIEAKSYRRHLFALARALRRRLLEPEAPWQVFTHSAKPEGDP